LIVAAENLATINWGDGTASAGVIAPAPGGGFQVIGGHTYQRGGPFPVLVTITSGGGSKATALSPASVGDLLSPLSGTLSPASDTGPSATDGVTAVNRPTFVGFAAPNTTVRVWAQPAGSAAVLPIGMVQANASGAWAAPAVVPLPDGTYSVFASATTAAGRPASAVTPLLPTASKGPLVIDTAGPKVLAAALDPTTAQFHLTIADAASGLSPATLLNPLAYSVALATPTGALMPLPVTGLVAGPGGTPNLQQVSLGINGGRPLAAGSYVLTINPAVLTDVAGAPLDERFFIPFPGPYGGPGSVYVAQFTTDGRALAGAQQYVPLAELQAANLFNQLIHGRRRPRG
jgi:hypothetical protein